MISGLSVQLTQIPFPFPPNSIYGAILSGWEKADFDKKKSSEVLKNILEQTQLADSGFFDAEAVNSGNLIATEKLLFPENWKWCFGISNQQPPLWDFSDFIQKNQLGDFLKMIDLLNDPFSKNNFKKNFVISKTFGELHFEKILVNKKRERWPTRQAPGIYRHEHATLLISSGKNQVLLDPVSLSPVVPKMVSTIELSPKQNLDAILITHAHGDHWDIPSIYQCKKNNDPLLIVPEVSIPNIFSPSFSHQLGQLGIKHRVGKWGETIKVGDIEIDVLPFYGEQPSQEMPWNNPYVRNWGNCYRINTPSFSALVLVDSGTDPYGNMTEAVRESVDLRGPCDIVIACMREFLSPFEIPGLGYYWTVYTFEQLQMLYKTYKNGKLKSSTAGLSGIAEICRIAQAKAFLPYAEGFEGAGKPIGASEWGVSMDLSEKEAIMRAKKYFKSLKIPTEPINWNPGDRVFLKNKKVVHQPPTT